jgi:hypothetical protein
MRKLLFILCFIALLSAMGIELTEKNFGTLEYSIEERGASNSNLTIIAFKGNVQLMVQEVQGFNGIYSGEISIIEPGTYTVKAFNENTGKRAEASISLAPQEKLLPTEESVEKLRGEIAQEQLSLETVSEQAPWLPYLIVVLFVFIVALLIFGNPLTKPKKKK